MDWDSRVREQMLDRVWVDFNSGTDRRDSDGRYFRQPSLDTVGSKRDLDRLGLELSEGLRLQVYMEDQDVDGRPGALVASGVALHRQDFGWLVEIPDDAVERVACD